MITVRAGTEECDCDCGPIECNGGSIPNNIFVTITGIPPPDCSSEPDESCPSLRVIGAGSFALHYVGSLPGAYETCTVHNYRMDGAFLELETIMVGGGDCSMTYYGVPVSFDPCDLLYADPVGFTGLVVKDEVCFTEELSGDRSCKTTRKWRVRVLLRVQVRIICCTLCPIDYTVDSGTPCIRVEVQFNSVVETSYFGCTRETVGFPGCPEDQDPPPDPMPFNECEDGYSEEPLWKCAQFYHPVDCVSPNPFNPNGCNYNYIIPIQLDDDGPPPSPFYASDSNVQSCYCTGFFTVEVTE